MKQIVCTILLPCRSLQIELTYVNNLFKAFLCAAVKSKGFYSYFSKLFIFLFDAVIDKVKKNNEFVMFYFTRLSRPCLLLQAGIKKIVYLTSQLHEFLFAIQI